MHFQYRYANIESLHRDMWLSVGNRLICVVEAVDPDGRGVHAPERAARFGGRLVTALAPALDREPAELEALANDTCRDAVREIDGSFEPLIMATTPAGLWVAGRGGREVLALGQPASEPVHASDSMYWSHPNTPEYQSRLVLQAIFSQTLDHPLRCRLVSLPPDTMLRVFMYVPKQSERDAMEAGEPLDTPGATQSLSLFLRPK